MPRIPVDTRVAEDQYLSQKRASLVAQHAVLTNEVGDWRDMGHLKDRRDIKNAI